MEGIMLLGSHRCLVLGLLLATPLPLCAQPAAEPHVDWEGNPVPKEAIARVGSMRMRHDAAIRAAAYSPDGKTIVSVAADDTMRWWDAKTGKELRRIEVKESWHAQLQWDVRGTSIHVMTDGLYQ